MVDGRSPPPHYGRIAVVPPVHTRLITKKVCFTGHVYMEPEVPFQFDISDVSRSDPGDSFTILSVEFSHGRSRGAVFCTQAKGPLEGSELVVAGSHVSLPQLQHFWRPIVVPAGTRLEMLFLFEKASELFITLEVKSFIRS